MGKEEREKKDPKKKGAIDFDDKTDDKSLLNYKKLLNNWAELNS